MTDLNSNKKIPISLEYDQLEQLISNYINKFINKRISGAQISITKKDKIIFSESYGLSNRENHKKVTNSNTFNYASVSKLFIWVSIMQLVEKNKLDLSESIFKYLPEDFKLKLYSNEPITLLHLMNHTAGFEASWIHTSEDGVPLSSSDFNSMKETLLKGYSGIQCFNPGEVHSYSNFGATIAAYIVEYISGVPYYQYVMDNIFKPCKMNCCYPERKPIKEIIDQKVTGYRYHKKSDEFKLTDLYWAEWLYASGSVIGTANDLSKFAIELMSTNMKNKLFKNKETLKELLSMSYTSGNKELFSVFHGFLGTDGNYRGIGHTGCVEGMSSHFLILPEEELSVTILINDQNADDICVGLLNLITGSDYSKTINEELPSIELFKGEYVKTRTQIVNRTTPFEIMEVTVNDKNSIKLKLGNRIEIYKQIKPYIFENIDAPENIPCNKKIYFQVHNNKVKKYVSFACDWLPIEKFKKYN